MKPHVSNYVAPNQSPQLPDQNGGEEINYARESALYRNFFGRGRNKYLVYPDYWPKSWGQVPLLGVVHADDEFLAEKIAYDNGVLPTHFNCTFGPRFKQV